MKTERPSDLENVTLSHGAVMWNGDGVTHPCVRISLYEDTMSSVSLTIPEVNKLIKKLENETVLAALYPITH
jgi:hypothetical protein